MVANGVVVWEVRRWTVAGAVVVFGGRFEGFGSAGMIANMYSSKYIGTGDFRASR